MGTEICAVCSRRFQFHGNRDHEYVGAPGWQVALEKQREQERREMAAARQWFKRVKEKDR